MLSDERIQEIAARLARMVTINPLPWSGIATSYIRSALRRVIVSAQELMDSEADYLRESAQDLTDLLAEVPRLHAACATAQAGAWLMARHAPTCRAPLQSSTPGMARVCTCETGRVLRSAFAGDGAVPELLLVQIVRRGRGVPLPYPLDTAGE